MPGMQLPEDGMAGADEKDPTRASQEVQSRGAQGAALCCMHVEERTAPFAESRHFRALKVDLSVEFHQHLDGQNLRMIRRRRRSFMHKLVREVFDRMAKHLEGASGPGTDAALADDVPTD